MPHGKYSKCMMQMVASNGCTPPLFVHVDTLGGSLLPPIFSFLRCFFTCTTTNTCHFPLCLHVPTSFFNRLWALNLPDSFLRPQHQLFEPSHDCNLLFKPLFNHKNFLGTQDFFSNVVKPQKLIHTFFYHLTTSCHSFRSHSTPSPQFSYAILARHPLVCHFHPVLCWFHPSFPVSSQFLLFVYSSLLVSSWFTIFIWFLTDSTSVCHLHMVPCWVKPPVHCFHLILHWFHPSSCHLCVALYFHPICHQVFTFLFILQCIYSLRMLTLNHIPTLDSAADYSAWSKSVMHTPQGKGF